MKSSSASLFALCPWPCAPPRFSKADGPQCTRLARRLRIPHYMCVLVFVFAFVFVFVFAFVFVCILMLMFVFVLG